MQETQHRLLVVAHGTASAAGIATTRALVAALAAARPEVAVSLCFLDVAEPRLPDALAAVRGPLVVLPLLLSTGYHVQTDIPAAVAGRPDVRVARHLGPHEDLTEALADRLPSAPADATVALAATGSSRPEAAAELAAAADLLARRTGRTVRPTTLAGDVAATLRALPQPLAVASYLLAEGRFLDVLRAAAEGVAPVADPIGVHPALVRLVWRRYDEAVAAGTDGTGARAEVG